MISCTDPFLPEGWSCGPDDTAPFPTDAQLAGQLTVSPVTDLDEGVHFPRFDDLPAAAPLQLEKRGLTPQIRQRELWRPALHHKSTVATKLAAAGMHAEAVVIGGCHTKLSVAECYSCGATRQFLNRCDRFYCPACQPRLANERRETVEWWTKEVSQPKHVVLTVRNTARLAREHVDSIRAAFTRLRRTTFASNWRGGFYSLEVTNEGRGWHLHIHVLVDSPWVDAKRLAVLWHRCTRGAGYIVKVKDVRDKSYLREVTKYAVKGTDLAKWDAEDVAAFVRAFTGVRAFGVFGVLHGLRTKWREWLDSLQQSGDPCECGCVDWRIQSEGEYEFRHIAAGDGRPEPPVCSRPAVHPELFLRG